MQKLDFNYHFAEYFPLKSHKTPTSLENLLALLSERLKHFQSSFWGWSKLFVMIFSSGSLKLLPEPISFHLETTTMCFLVCSFERWAKWQKFSVWSLNKWKYMISGNNSEPLGTGATRLHQNIHCSGKQTSKSCRWWKWQKTLPRQSS